jgi:hypothetical protein
MKEIVKLTGIIITIIIMLLLAVFSDIKIVNRCFLFLWGLMFMAIIIYGEITKK